MADVFASDLEDMGFVFTIPSAATRRVDFGPLLWHHLDLAAANEICRQLIAQNTPLVGVTVNVDVNEEGTILCPANANGRRFILWNHGPDEIRFAMGATPSYDADNPLGIPLAPNQGYESPVCSSEAVNAICDADGTAKISRTLLAK